MLKQTIRELKAACIIEKYVYSSTFFLNLTLVTHPTTKGKLDQS